MLLKNSAKLIEYRLEAWKSDNIYRTIFNLTESSKQIINDSTFTPDYLVNSIKSDRNFIKYRSEISAIIFNDSLYEAGTDILKSNKELFKEAGSSFYDKKTKAGFLILLATLKSGNSLKFVFKIDYQKMLNEAVKLVDVSNNCAIGIVNNYDLLYLESTGNDKSLENYFELKSSKIDYSKYENIIEISEDETRISAIFFDKELNLLVNVSSSKNSLLSVFDKIKTLIYAVLIITVLISIALMFILLRYKKADVERLEKKRADLEKQVSLRTKDLAKANANVQRNAKRLKAVIENAGDAIITVYENGIIRYFNKTAEKIFDYDDDEIKGRHFNFLLPRRERRYFNMLLNRFKKDPNATIIGKVINVYCKRKDGTIFPAEMSLSEVEFEEKHLFTCIVKDITLRRKSEAQLLEASRAADRANEAKSSFLASMSHELRTPLNGILGYAQILERDKTLSEKQLKGINIIKNSGEHLLSLINDILDLSKIEAQKYELNKTTFNLEEQLKTVVSLIKIKADQKGIGFEINRLSEIPKIVVGDSKVIKQIFLNLLGNAIKFTDSGKVTLNIGYRNKTEKVLFAEILDTGIGIAENKIGEIFEPFKQVQTLNRTVQGTGLGLSITNKLIALMNGRIQVESQVNKGSKFVFEIELETATVQIDDEVISKPSVVGFTGEKKKILAVDDNKTNLELYKTILSDVGFDIDVCESGTLALQKLSEVKYDLIVMDLIMPELNGYETSKKIKENSQWSEIPIIVVSASSLSNNELLHDKSIFNNYLLKPFNNNDFLNLIGEHLNIEWQYDNKLSSIEKGIEEDIIYPEDSLLSSLLNYAELGDYKKIEEELSLLSNRNLFSKFINLTNEYIKQYDEEGLINFLKNVRSRLT